MAYLIDHLLKPDAAAQRSSAHWFTKFTFDHQLSGIIAACRRDTHDLVLIEVTNNVVREHPLACPLSGRTGSGPLPYEAAIDALSTRRRRKRQPL